MVGIETDRGLWVAALVAAGYRCTRSTPRRWPATGNGTTSAAASPMPGTRKVLADMVRIDAPQPPAGRRRQRAAEAIKVLARAHQYLIWDRTRHSQPAAQRAAGVLSRRAGRVRRPGRPRRPRGAGQGPRPRHAAARLTRPRSRRPCGRVAGDATSTRRPSGSRPRCAPSSSPRPARSRRRTPPWSPPRSAIIAAINTQLATLEAQLADRFEQHPDADIILSPARPG